MTMKPALQVKTVDLGNAETVEEMSEKFELEQLNINFGLAELMKIRTCRLWMWALLTRLGLFDHSTTDFSAPNPAENTIYLQAQQDAARQIWNELVEAAPEELLMMQRECMDRLGEKVKTENTNRRRRRRRRKAKGPGTNE